MAFNLGKFISPNEHGKTARECTAEIREVGAERRKRIVNHNTVEDQNHHLKNLRDARARTN